MKSVSRRQIKDIRIIGRFAEVYCLGRHGDVQREEHRLTGSAESFRLCSECAALADYAAARRLRCPLEENKPTCKHCHIHCYAPEQRRWMQEVMAYSGRKLLLRGRIDYIWHYFF